VSAKIQRREFITLLYIDKILKGTKLADLPRGAGFQVPAGHQSQDRQGAWPNDPGIIPIARRRGDRVNVLFVVVHESGVGTTRKNSQRTN
jgi:hypothetical protein